MSNKPAWFKFYPADWLLDVDVRAMTPEQRSAYLDLLCYQSRDGFLPESSKNLGRLLGFHGNRWARIWVPPLSDKFPVCEDGKRRNPKLLEALDTFKRLSAAGEKGGRPQSPVKAIEKRPLLDQDQEQDQEAERNKAARERALPKRPIWWDMEGGKLDGTPEAKKKIAADWVGPDKLTMAELKEEMETATYWLSDHPTKRTPRSDLKRFLYNWLKRTIESKRSGAKARSRIEQKRGEGRPQPEPVKQKWCPRCRETLPAHSEWCPDRADADWDTEGKGV